MKTKYIFFSLVALCMLSACTKDEEVAITTVQINNLSIAPQYTRSAFACDLVANSPIADVELQYSTDPLFGEGLYQTLQLNQNEHHYTANLESLQQGQTYYVRYKVFNSFNSMIPTRVDIFRTRAYTLPSVRTDSVTHITTHSADCYFTLTDWGCDSLPIVGVCFSTSLSDRTNIPCTTTLSDSTFVCSLSDLTDGKTYSVYAFAKNAQGTAYSEKVITFTTIAIVPPTVVTSDVTAISYTSAVCGGDISSDGNAEVTERGICYATTAQPTTQDSVILCGSGTGSFSTVLPNLQDGVTYYVRAYATNGKGTAYGEQKIFATPAYSLPTLTTAEVTNISYTTATCGGNITSDGIPITERGVCYSTRMNPTISDTKIVGSSGIGAFSCNLIGLSDETTYYIRAYAIDSKGRTAYGDQKVFNTWSYTLPTLGTITIEDVSYTFATCKGNVISSGNTEITECGVCYSIQNNPTIADSIVRSDITIGAFNCRLTGLLPGTTYYVRAYATNSKGTAYGEQTTIITKHCNEYYFSISASNIVLFSKGNLQYQAISDTWRFAPNQWEFVGEANDSISKTYSGWIDLFGWGTGNNPTKTSSSEVYDDFIDWGCNTIGLDVPNTWRTLTYDEWGYVLHNRSNAADLLGYGTVEGVIGLIILPDNWAFSSDVSFVPIGIKYYCDGSSARYYCDFQREHCSDNVYTSADWNKMEQAGAVFLPAAGFRSFCQDIQWYPCTIDIQWRAQYWSSTDCTPSPHRFAYCIYFADLERNGNYPFEVTNEKVQKHVGFSVRLVKDL